MRVEASRITIQTTNLILSQGAGRVKTKHGWGRQWQVVWNQQIGWHAITRLRLVRDPVPHILVGACAIVILNFQRNATIRSRERTHHLLHPPQDLCSLSPPLQANLGGTCAGIRLPHRSPGMTVGRFGQRWRTHRGRCLCGRSDPAVFEPVQIRRVSAPGDRHHHLHPNRRTWDPDQSHTRLPTKSEIAARHAAADQSDTRKPLTDHTHLDRARRGQETVSPPRGPFDHRRRCRPAAVRGLWTNSYRSRAESTAVDSLAATARASTVRCRAHGPRSDLDLDRHRHRAPGSECWHRGANETPDATAKRRPQVLAVPATNLWRIRDRRAHRRQYPQSRRRGSRSAKAGHGESTALANRLRRPVSRRSYQAAKPIPFGRMSSSPSPFRSASRPVSLGPGRSISKVDHCPPSDPG